jgi:hypothetical protein
MSASRFLLYAAGSLALCAASFSPGLSRASQIGRDDPWSAERIERLPPEIRGSLAHMCRSSPSAGHYFATYLDHARLIKLHFEHLRCDGGARFCNESSCLRQEYFSTGSRYQLIRNYYGSND